MTVHSGHTVPDPRWRGYRGAMDQPRRDNGAGIDLWEQMRAEERAEKLAQVVQDAERDQKIADLLETGDHESSRSR